jgi:outer membrane protein OmpA-like peptidoglycan-associated protein
MPEKQYIYEMLDTSPTIFPYKWVVLTVFMLVGSAMAYMILVHKKPYSVSTSKTTSGDTSPTTAIVNKLSPTVVSPSQIATPDHLITTTSETIYFNFNTAHVSSSQLIELQSFYSKIQGKTGSLIIEGHSDELGASDYNQWLSTVRAQSVVRASQQLHINDQDYKITVKGLGETQPVQREQTEKARALNRRVVLTFRDSN